MSDLPAWAWTSSCLTPPEMMKVPHLSGTEVGSWNLLVLPNDALGDQVNRHLLTLGYLNTLNGVALS